MQQRHKYTTHVALFCSTKCYDSQICSSSTKTGDERRDVSSDCRCMYLHLNCLLILSCRWDPLRRTQALNLMRRSLLAHHQPKGKCIPWILRLLICIHVRMLQSCRFLAACGKVLSGVSTLS